MTSLEKVLQLFNVTPNKRGGQPTEIPGKNRDDLAALFHTLGYEVGAEVGTEKGRYAKTMCDANPGVKLYCVDAWKIYEGYRCRAHKGPEEQSRVDGYLAECKQRLAPYNIQYVRKFSMDAVNDFADNSLDYVYLDGNHTLKYVVEDLVYWTPKVRSGGIVSGHDFLPPGIKGSLSDVAPAMFAYTWAYGIKPWFVLSTQKETANLNHGKARSFFFIKKET